MFVHMVIYIKIQLNMATHVLYWMGKLWLHTVCIQLKTVMFYPPYQLFLQFPTVYLWLCMVPMLMGYDILLPNICTVACGFTMVMYSTNAYGL